jgi:hypothetical protein
MDEEDVDEHVGRDESEIQSGNGKSLNGISLNGISLNGVSLNGVSLNGVSLNGTSLNGVSLNGTSLNGTTTTTTTTPPAPTATPTMTTLAVGSKWTATLSNGQALPMRIDSATKGTGSNIDVGMYAVSYQTSAGWQRLCESNADGTPVLALAVPGTWNQQTGVVGGGAYTASPTQFTWACRAKTIAKCVELGYKPWTNRVPQLASCVRMLRGDYCGDGSPNTVDGQLLNVYDNVGIQADTEAWMAEAEWTPTGARCISEKKELRFSQLNLPTPSCIQSKVLKTTSTCGTTFASGATIISEYAGAVASAEAAAAAAAAQ